MFSYLEERTPAEVEAIRRTIQELLRQTCILQVKYDPVTLTARDNARYQVCLKHREFIADYLSVIGCELVHDPQDHLFRITGDGAAIEKMSLTTTKLLLLLKLIYRDKIMGEGLHATVTTLAEIREYGRNTGLLPGKLNAQDWQAALNLMKTHQMIELPGAILNVEDQTPIYIYGTVNISALLRRSMSWYSVIGTMQKKKRRKEKWQVKQAKKIFTRMCLNNWGGINHKILEFHEYVNLFSGKSGSGKSTVMDAIQVVLYGSFSPSFLNKAADDAKNRRSVLSYLRGEQKDGTANREGQDFCSQIVLELQDTGTKQYVCMGIAFEVRKNDSEIRKFVYFSHLGKMPEGGYLTEEGYPYSNQEIRTLTEARMKESANGSRAELNRIYREHQRIIGIHLPWHALQSRIRGDGPVLRRDQAVVAGEQMIPRSAMHSTVDGQQEDYRLSTA